MSHKSFPESGLPVVQAPMAGVQDERLALAVAAAGGTGSLPAALMSVEALRRGLERLRAAAARYNLNFFCHAEPAADTAREAAWRKALAPCYGELGVDPAAIPAGPARAPFSAALLDLLREFRPPIVSFHFGLPEPALLAAVKACGAQVWASATTVAEARWLESRGADVVIAQGFEAGGHRGMFLDEDLGGQLGTFALLPQVVAAVRVPVIAAGGIADARTAAAARLLGAAAVQAGTAYLRTPEATTSALHRAALMAAEPHTVVTNVFTGRPARGIANRLVREFGPLSPLAPAFPLAANAVAPLRAAAEARGSADFSPLWAGQNRSGCSDAPAATVTRMLAGLA